MFLDVSKFLYPYLQFVTGAALSFRQVLEGFEYSRSGFFSNYLSGVVFVALILPLVSLLLLPLIFGAAYTLGRLKGVMIALCLLIAPGVLNLIGLFPDLQYGPPSFSIGGAGVLGSVMGLIPLLVMATAAGWSITILLYDTLKLTDKFRHYYDHFWFLSALAAAIFFVTDNTASNNEKSLSEASRAVQSSSRYLLVQIRRYQDYCRLNGLESTKSCQWSNYSQWTIGPLAEYAPVLFVQLGPESSREFFQPPREEKISDEDVLVIRRELLEYNQKVCPVTQLSKDSARYAPLSDSCEAPPFEYCTSWPDGPEGFVDRYIAQRPVAIANECIIPNLVSLKYAMPKLLAGEREAKQVKNYRWLYFIFIALAVGGKVANSSTKLVDFEKRLPEERGIFVKDLRRFAIFLSSLARKALGSVLAFVCYAAKVAKVKCRALRRLAKRDAP